MEERLANEILTHPITPDPQLKEKKTCTKWQKQTRRSLTTDFNLGGASLRLRPGYKIKEENLLEENIH